MNPSRILRKRILVVDDEPEARNLLKLLLSIDQHEVLEAENGKQACHMFTPGDFDLIITDYDMPEMKGDELARTIKTLVPSQRIMMITGIPGTLASRDNPVDAVIIKPVTMDELRQFIAALFSPAREKRPFRWSTSGTGKGIGLGLT